MSKKKIRLCKYLNNSVEQDKSFIKWRVQHMIGFKSFESASSTLTGIDAAKMIKKEQITAPMATYFKTLHPLAA